MIAEVDARMTGFGAPADIAIWAMIETPLGVLHAPDIAAAPRIATYVMGTNDLVKELRASHTVNRLPLAASLGWTLLAARAHGLACIDGVYNAFRDEEGLHAACIQGRDYGFDGKTLIHPDQIATANAVFAPTRDAISLAQRHVEAFAEATARGQGVAVVDGRIVENLHVDNARRVLAEAEAIAELEAGAAQGHQGAERPNRRL
jgi:citrate lyase beta subunit